MSGLFKSIKYLCEYYSVKNKLQDSARIFQGGGYRLKERNNAAINMKKNVKHVTGLLRMLGHFDDSVEKRRNFEDRLWKKIQRKYE